LVRWSLLAVLHTNGFSESMALLKARLFLPLSRPGRGGKTADFRLVLANMSMV
jgi:hypothetical protein